MPATVLASPFRYSAIKKDVYLVPTIAVITAPTRSELNAGTNIKFHLDKDNGLQGFELQPQSVVATDLGSGIGYNLNDGDTYPQATISAFMNKPGSSGDLRSVISEGDATFIVIFDTLDTAGLKMDVFAVNVRPISKTRAGVEMLSIPMDISNSARDVTVPS